LRDAAVAWAALVPPDCYTAYAFSKRALQATTMACHAVCLISEASRSIMAPKHRHMPLSGG
jgi:hypothetical protein